MYKQVKINILSFLFLLVIFSSCTMKQNIYIDKSGGGSSQFEIKLAEYLTVILDQITMLLEPENQEIQNQENRDEESFFDLIEIRKDFQQKEGVELISLDTPSKNTLVADITFQDINDLLNNAELNLAESYPISFNRQGDVSELIVRIDRETVQTLLAANPSFNNPLVESFGPMTTEGLSDEDYLTMMEFALGTESRRGISESFLELTIQVEGQILEQKSGKMINKNTVRYIIPMLPFLMLREPLEYSLRFR